ncbi:MAG: hypothetical protein JSS49_11450 [Planctomycetes bacterium]|nr:hypothetical protein [Planctomycetota bacterium]
MTELINTVCEHCDARLKLKNPDLEGKKIKCPKCGEAFIVTVAEGAKSAIKRSAKKKPSDVDLSYMDGNSDEDVEDYDADNEPRRRTSRSRGSKKKSKKKSRGSGSAVQIVLIVGLVLGALLFLGGAGYGIMLLANGDGSSDLDWLPSDTRGYVKLQVDNVWAAGVLQSFKNGSGGTSLAKEVTEGLGIGPQDIDQVIVSIPANGQRQVFIVRGKQPFDKTKLIGSSKIVQEVSHGGLTYLKKSPSAVLFQPDSKTVIMTTESILQSVITRGKKNPAAKDFGFARNYRDHLVVATLGTSQPATSISTISNPFMAPMAPLSEARTMLLRANATSDIRMSVQASFATADAAKSNVDRSQADLNKGKSQFTLQKTQLQSMPANPMIQKDKLIKMMDGAEQVLNSVQISQSGSNMHAQITIPGTLINDAVDMFNSGPSGSMPGLNPFSTLFGR